MKRYLLAFLLVAIVMNSGCLKDTVSETYTFYRPVYRTRDEVRNNIRSGAATAIQQPGKIVLSGHYLFLNEVDRGIHVIDIAQPANPVNTAFIEIPGCVDLMINGNHLYADCYTDLVTLDITNPASVSLRQINEGAFPKRFYTHFTPDTTKVIQRWIRVDTTVRRGFNESFRDMMPDKSIMYLASAAFSTQSSGFTSGGAAIAGSLARFALQNNRLYTVSSDDLNVFNTTQAATPSFVRTVDLKQGNIETIFPYKNNLFIGSQSGMFIYNAANPDQPQQSGQFTHARSCDPVIADDRYAYVTLSGGSFCGGFSNQLDVVNITNLASPTLIKSYPLTGPRGLAKENNTLLICDGKSGLKIFDVSPAASITLVGNVQGFEASDVIAVNGLAITVAKDGIYLIDYTTPSGAAIVGKIQVAQKQ